MPLDITALGDNILLTQVKRLANWCRKYSLWPLPFATACCGIELMATYAPRYDAARFGAEVLRFSPRQADLIIVSSRVAVKMMPLLQRIYLQMCEPKWVVSMGACACTGGVFDNYAVVQGIDQFMPVDVYIPGCPPRPETLIEGIMAIQRIVEADGIPPRAERPLGVRIDAPGGSREDLRQARILAIAEKTHKLGP
jgi:NADH-quinone oxidoreductase subunit B